MAPSLSTWEKFCLTCRLVFLLPWQILAALFSVILVASTRKLPLRLYFRCAFIKACFSSLSPRQMQYLRPPTKETYRNWVHCKTVEAKKNNDQDVLSRLKPLIELLGDAQSSLLWLGDRKNAKKVVLFFHGGGYAVPLVPGHLEWCWRAYVTAGVEANVETAVAVLEYTLCPQAKYPTQLCQAVGALSHILSSGFRPRDIVIGGDSAGGNLAGQLLCHFAQPNPMAKPIQLTEPLAGAFLVSPWLTERTNDQSYAKNASIDMLSASAIQKVVRELLGDAGTAARGDEFRSRAFPLDTHISCFDGMAAITRQMYVTAGDHEVFRDQIIAFVDKVRSVNPSLTIRFDLLPRQAHDFILLEGRLENNGECTEAMKHWWKRLLTTDLEF